MLNLDLETQYKLDNRVKSSRTEELDIEKLIDLRQKSVVSRSNKDSSSKRSVEVVSKMSHPSSSKKSEKSSSKNLSYGSSSDED